MFTKRKSNWVRLISIGVVLLGFPYLIELISSYDFSIVSKYVFMVIGITMGLIGLILKNKEERQTNQQ